MPYDERDAETNRFTPTYEDSEFLDAVRALEVAGTKDVSERVGCTQENARVRLNRLADEDQLEKRKIGERNIYTIAE